jgi:bifunctional non-homologous end joining protein LigD
MALEDYARKRTFAKTPEPEGTKPEGPTQTRGGTFCVQRHHARQLHYDLRIEIGGVLKSWAVPKGPTLDPDEKRMAVLVEDHPMEYATFEGVIPKGNYGAGSMMLYDHGSYEVIGEPAAEAQLQRGDFKFRLHGHKLRGDFALVRTRDNQWLLIKKRDEHAIKGWDSEMYARSVKTGRTQQEIAGHVQPGHAHLPGAIHAPMPRNLVPMLAMQAAQPPRDPGWIFEVKWDGVRGLCYVDRAQTDPVIVFSRNQNNMNRQYPEAAALAEALDAQTAIVDCEIVALDSRGLPSFGLLQHRMHLTDPVSVAHLSRTQPVTLYVFDILYLDGWDLRRVPIEDRKRVLASVLIPTSRVRISDHFVDQGEELFSLARQTGLEGVVAKRLGSAYENRRSGQWLKIKVTQQQEFVICGLTEGERLPFGSLALGAYDSGRLVYVGNVGSGFDEATLKLVAERLQPLHTSEIPFAVEPEIANPTAWIRPEVVCEVKFSSWTEERHLRAPVFLGLRNDAQAKDCLLEAEQPPVPEPALTLPPPLLTDDRDKVVAEINQRRLTFTNLNKIYYPEEGYCKRDVVNYYAQVADLILPYLRDRPLSLRRYPDGIHGESFFQKAASEHFPEWLRQVPIYSAHNDAPTRFVVADDRAALLFLANLGCIDQNPWMSRIPSLENPDFILIDLDPQECGYDRIVEAAQLVRQKLDLMELSGYPKTTGGDGMHIYIPIEPVYTFEQARTFAQLLAYILGIERPDLFTMQRAVSRRDRNRVYFDWAQISSGKTISAPYVLRAYPGAPVATPLEWREVKPGLTPQQFHIRNAIERFARVGDLFRPVLEKRQRIETALDRLELLVNRKA